MISKFAIVAGLAVLTHAFLVPPEISSSDTKLIDTLPIEAAIEAQRQILSLECSGCPFPSVDAVGNKVWSVDVDNQLKLFFSVEHSNDGDFLSLNDHQIFPPMPMLDPLTVIQVTKGDVARHVHLGLELSFRGSVKDTEEPENGLELIPITLQVVEVDNQLINGLQSVEIQLLRAPDGSLLIMKINTAETKNPLINPTEKGEKCRTIICMLRASIGEKVGKFRKTKGCGSKTKTRPGGMGKHKHNGARPHGGPNRHLRKQNFLARIFCAMKKVTFHIILPIFVGLVVGVSACFIGRMTASMIVFMWRKFYRRGQKGTYSKVQQEDTDVKIFVAEDAPPAYEDNVDEKAAS